MPLKETSSKKCPFCSSIHVSETGTDGFSNQNYYPPEENTEPSSCPIYHCRNCATRFYFTGY